MGPVMQYAQSNPEVEYFIRANQVDDKAAASLRELEPHLQSLVLARGDLSGASNPSSALMVRIKDSRMGVHPETVSFGACMRPTPGMQYAQSNREVEHFILVNQVDDKAAASL